MLFDAAAQHLGDADVLDPAFFVVIFRNQSAHGLHEESGDVAMELSGDSRSDTL